MRPVAKAFFFDSSLCTGCKTCELACKDYHDLGPGIAFRKVFDIEGGAWDTAGPVPVARDVYVYHVSVACAHCSQGVCLEVCPTGAMHRDENGMVWPSHDRCVGCGYCVMACPYGAPVLDLDAKKSRKCDGCTSRVGSGLAPICVEACPLRALDYREVADLASVHPDLVLRIEPLPDPAYTAPNLLINPSPATVLAAERGGWVANPGEI